MNTWICKACATQVPPSEEPPAACTICEDPRQYIPQEGQVWLRWDDFVSDHTADIREDHGLLGFGCKPSFAIGQRALLVRSRAGNVLWDCIPLLDRTIEERIAHEGGLAAIAISHPHFYSAMVEWAHVFGCPIWLHESQRKWVQRPDDSLRFWSGETKGLGGGLTLVRCGGHYEGSQVLHLAEQRALLSGDTVHVIPDRRFVSFMYSYPNLIPLPPSRVRAIGAALEPFEFDTIHGSWWDSVVERDGSAVVRRSVERYLRAIADPGLAS